MAREVARVPTAAGVRIAPTGRRRPAAGRSPAGYTCVELDGCDTACRLRFIARAERVIEAGAALPRA